MTITFPLTILFVAFVLTLVHACTGGKVPVWIPLLLVIIALAIPK